MGADARPPLPRTGGTRYCRGVRRRTGHPYARLTARHVGGRVVVLPRPAPGPAPRTGSRTGPVTAAVAVAALVVCVTLLLTGVAVESPRAGGPCPARTSVTAVADGHSLRVRREQTDDFTALVHLCASPSLGPVRSWSISLLPATPRGDEQAASRGDEQAAPRGDEQAAPRGDEQAAPRGDEQAAQGGQVREAVAVQRLGDRLALGVAPMAADRRATLTVTAVPRTGPPVTFSAELTPA